MKLPFSVFLAGLPLIGLGVGSPTPGDGWGDWHGCLSDADAEKIVNTVEQMYNCIDVKVANQVLSPDYTAYSYSSLRPGPGEIPTGSVVSSSREEFIQQRLDLQNDPCIDTPFKTVKFWHGCDTVTFWWTLDLGPPLADKHYLYTGIDLVEVEKGSHLIKADYSEFSG